MAYNPLDFDRARESKSGKYSNTHSKRASEVNQWESNKLPCPVETPNGKCGNKGYRGKAKYGYDLCQTHYKARTNNDNVGLVVKDNDNSSEAAYRQGLREGIAKGRADAIREMEEAFYPFVGDLMHRKIIRDTDLVINHVTQLFNHLFGTKVKKLTVNQKQVRKV